MAVQDLTPQLRTRLSRVERMVGLFVVVATLLMVFGFVFYVYHTAKRKGWFLTKVTYFTLADTAAGLRVGDPVKLMGFDVGEITRIDAQPPGDMFNVYVEFNIQDPYFGYLWTDSRAEVSAADFLGKRAVQVTKGTNGVPTHLRWEFKEHTLAEAQSLVGKSNLVVAREIRGPEAQEVQVQALQPLSNELLTRITAAGWERIPVADRSHEHKNITAIWNDQLGSYEPLKKEIAPYWLPPLEEPALTELLGAVVRTVQTNLPGVFNLTNQIAVVLSNTIGLLRQAGTLVTNAQPITTNLAVITGNLREPRGALGEWLLPTNLHSQLLVALTNASATLTNASATLASADTNLVVLASSLYKSLENLANLTGNLNAQVQTNDQILSEISAAIVHADQLMQGLKKHWLLRSAFKEPKTNKPSSRPVRPRRTPTKGAELLK